MHALLQREGLGAFYDGGGLGSLAPRRRAQRADAIEEPAVVASDGGTGAATLDLVGMRCASCAWLIERYLERQPGATVAHASYSTSTCTLRWDPSRTSLAALLAALERIGYRGRPADPRLRRRQAEREERLLQVRTGLSLLLAMNVMLASVGLYLGEIQGIAASTREALRLLAGALAAPVVFWGGWPFVRGAWAALRARRATMDTLVALGALTAFAASAAGFAAGGHVYFDTAAMIVALILVGRTIEQAARRRGMRAVRSLLAMEPSSARLWTPEGTRRIEAADLQVGLLVEVRPGERFPCDGTVVAGSSEADESILTGEAAPRELEPGSRVHGGALNGGGMLRVRADRVGSETTAARIMAAVERAMASRAPLERLADRTVGIFVPLVLAAALAAGALWWALGDDPYRALMIGVAVVVIACPCALGLATPAAVVVAVGEAARRGVFFRDAESLERAAAVSLVAFDKTGTLTDGRLTVAAIGAAPGWSEDEVLRFAAAAERHSEHAVARAIVAAAAGRGLEPEAASEFRSTPGGGVTAFVAGRRVDVGTAGFLTAREVREVPSAAAEATSAHVAVDGRWAGLILASDSVRAGAAEAVAALHRAGIRTAVLSGDTPSPVRRASATVGIAEADARHGLSPTDKAAVVAGWESSGHRVAVVGDGVNDAPALAAASLGIAVGGGTDVAMEAAGVVMAGSDLDAVPSLLALARRARRVVIQNLGWAIAYNAAAVPLAAAGLIHPAIAAAAMAFSSVSVLLNALRAAPAESATPRLERTFQLAP